MTKLIRVKQTINAPILDVTVWNGNKYIALNSNKGVVICSFSASEFKSRLLDLKTIDACFEIMQIGGGRTDLNIIVQNGIKVERIQLSDLEEIIK